MPLQFEPQDERALLGLARQTLDRLYDDNPESIVDDFAANDVSQWLLENLPCFVTLHTRRGRLRGCIGTLSTQQSVYKNVFQYTRAAALEDPRFDAVQAAEVSDLVIHISVLGPLHPLSGIATLQLGKQGLCVSYGSRRGVLLADVATEHGWNSEEFLSHTCEKAGLDPADVDKYKVQYFDQVSFGEKE